MSNIKQKQHLTITDYLSQELTNEIKHEYVNGQAYAMAGASVNHGRVSGNFFGELLTHLKKSTCEPFMSDMKVKTSTGNYRYPDVLVVCDNDFIDNKYATKTPVILVEVLSRSTRKTDNGRSTHYFMGETIKFESINLTLAVEDIYYRVENKDVIDFMIDKNQNVT